MLLTPSELARQQAEYRPQPTQPKTLDHQGPAKTTTASSYNVDASKFVKAVSVSATAIFNDLLISTESKIAPIPAAKAKVDQSTRQSQMWQIRNENLTKVLGHLEKNSTLKDTTTSESDLYIKIPYLNGVPVDGGDWNKGEAAQEEIWRKAIAGQGGYSLKEHQCVSPSGFLQKYEGVATSSISKDSSSAKSTNATLIQNVMSSRSNKLSQAQQDMQYDLSNLTSMINQVRDILMKLFDVIRETLRS